MDNEIVFECVKICLIHLEAITPSDREQIEDEEENTEPMIMRCSNLQLSYPIADENEQERYVTMTKFIH